MRQWASTSAKSLLMAAGFVALGSGVAFADSGAATSGNGSILGGNQAVANADVPVNVSGNAVGAVLGTAGASSTGNGASVIDHQHNDVRSSGNGSALGGNQLVVDGDVPVNVSGNAIGAVGGVAGAAATDTGALVEHDSHKHECDKHGHHDEDEIATSGNGSLAGGNQLVGDLDVPVNLSGNAVGAVLGTAGAAATDTGALVNHDHGRHHQSGTGELTATDLVSEAADGVQLLPDTSGVDAGLMRQSAPEREHQSIATSGNGSLLGGNQLVVDGDLPVNLSGNAIGAVGGVAGAASTDSGAIVKEDEHDVATSGNGSLLGGNQLVGDLDVPINVSGNAVGALGGIAGASSTGDGSSVVHQSGEETVEHQSGAPAVVPVVDELPEVPVSEMLPIDYDLTETAGEGQPQEQAPEQPQEQAPEQPQEEQNPEQTEELPQELPEASDVMPNDPVGDLLGAAGVGL